MGRNHVMLLLGVIMFVAASCTSGEYRPTVDTTNSPVAANLSKDEAECRALAKQSAGGTATEAGKGAVVGGLVGAAAGAAIGAAAGSPGTGAAVGAAAGGSAGGIGKGISSDQSFKQVFRNCMRNRGHTVLD